MRASRLLTLGIALAAIASCSGGGSAPTASNTITVTIKPANSTLQPGQHVQLTATVAGPPGIDTHVTWTSLNPDLATVNGTGLVTAVSEGAAGIKAAWFTDGNIFDVAQVQVSTTPIPGSPEPPLAPSAFRGSSH